MSLKDRMLDSKLLTYDEASGQWLDADGNVVPDDGRHEAWETFRRTGDFDVLRKADII